MPLEIQAQCDTFTNPRPDAVAKRAHYNVVGADKVDDIFTETGFEATEAVKRVIRVFYLV